MPRQKSIITIIRDLVRQEVNEAMRGIFGAPLSAASRKPGAGRGRRGPKPAAAGPGRPPGKRGPGRPKGSKNKPKMPE